MKKIIEDSEGKINNCQKAASFANFLRRYVEPKNIEDDKLVYEKIKNNVFIAKYIDFTYLKNECKGVLLAGDRPGNSPSGLTERISVATLADGLAKFYVNRVKAELNIAFFNKFQKLIQEQEEFTILFPATAMELGNIGTRIYNYNHYLKDLREKFFFDLRNLDKQTAYLLQNNYIKMNESARILAIDGLAVSHKIRANKASPPEIIEYLGKEATLQDTTLQDTTKLKDLRNALQLLNIFSEGLLSDATDRYWISPEEFFDLAQDSISLDLLLGLLYERAKKIEFRGKKVEDFVTDLASNPTKFYRLKKDFEIALNQIIMEGDRSKKAWDIFKKKNEGDSIGYQDYYAFIQPTLSIILHSKDIVKIFTSEDKVLKDVAKYVGIVSNLNEMILAVTQQKFSVAIANISTLLESIELKNKKVVEKILDYGNFMVAVVDAEDSDAVAAAIEAVALPVGSSLNKKVHGWSLEFNGYTGLRYGREELIGQTNNTQDIYAIYAPLGLTLSKGLGKGGALSVYGSIIDIGALTAFRFNDATTANLPEFDFSNIYAPGLYVIYGFPDIPLSLGFGFQDGPQLREINPPSATIVDGRTPFSVFLGVDIPLFRLFKTKRISD